MAHLEELRSRLIKSGLAVIAGFFACYGFSEQLTNAHIAVAADEPIDCDRTTLGLNDISAVSAVVAPTDRWRTCPP